MLSAILCSHNPRAAYLQRALDALRQQTLPRAKWELVLVDNRNAVLLSEEFDVSWHENARVICEDTLGLTPARLRGIRESRGELLVFVDDDNVLDANYLEEALRVAKCRPFLGSWSGQCRPEFEDSPPEWTRRYWGNLAIREFDTDRWSNLARLRDTMPCGAGLCVRRGVAEEYLRLHDCGERRFQFDRTGDSLMSGGDNDLAACACDVGLGVGLISSLRLVHLISPNRVSLGYLCRLAEGIHFSGVLLDYERGIVIERPGLGRRLLDWVRRKVMDRRHAAVLNAVNRGKTRAIQWIESLPDNGKHQEVPRTLGSGAGAHNWRKD